MIIANAPDATESLDSTEINPEPAQPPRRWWARVRSWMTWRVFLIVVLLVHVAPIWIVTYFPTQDGPAHIYNGKIFFESFSHANYQVRQFYDFGYQLFPNMLTHLMLGGLQQVFPPLIAEKIVLTVIVACWPLSLLYLLNSIERGRGVMCLIGLTFAYNNLFHIGFYNFSLSVSMCFFTIGWWWRYKDEMTLPRLGGFYGLALLTYVSHFAGFMAMVLTIGIATAWIILLRSIKALSRFRSGELKPDLKRIATWAITTLAITLPLLAAGWDYNFRNYRPESDGHRDLNYIINVFAETLTLMSYSHWHLEYTQYVLWTMLVVAGLTVIYRIFRLRVLQERDALLLACAAMIYLFFTLPWSRNDGGWVNDRLFIIAFLLPWAWFGRFPKWLNVIVGVALLVLSIGHTARLTYDYWLLQPDMRELAIATDKIEPHSTVAWELNADLKPPGFEEGIKLVNPWLHALSYYGLQKDVALFSNYEAGYTYFLTRWGETPRQNPDYIVAFGRSAADRARRDRPKYETVYESPKLTLIRQKRAEPDLKPWTTLADGSRVLRLSMRGRDVNDVRGVVRNRLFASGSFGWVRTAPRHEWPGPDGDKGDFPFLVGDQRDRAFRIDLPNGTYEVTCHFTPNREGAYRTCVIANDRNVGQVTVADPRPPTIPTEPVPERSWLSNQLHDWLRPATVAAPPEAVAQTLRYTIDITNGQLTQVFYTNWKSSTDPRRLRFWAISGIEIRSAGTPTTMPTKG